MSSRSRNSQAGIDLVDGKTEQGQSPLVDADLDLLLVAAVDFDGGDALGGLEILLDEFLGDIAQLVEAVSARQIEPDHGIIGRVEAQQQRSFRRPRQRRQIELLADVEGGKVHIATPTELEGDLRDARARHRAESLDAAGDPHELLDGPGDERLDLARSGARQPGLHRQTRVGQIRHEVQGQAGERHRAEEQERHRGHGNRHTTAERKVDDAHTCPPRESLQRSNREFVEVSGKLLAVSCWLCDGAKS